MEELNLYDEENVNGSATAVSAAEVTGGEMTEAKDPCRVDYSSASDMKIGPDYPQVIEITEDIYHDIAVSLLDAIGDGYYYNGKIENDCDEFYSTLTATLIVYREKSTDADGRADYIRDIVPVWWEFSTVVPQKGEALNDFCFRDLKDAALSAECL